MTTLIGIVANGEKPGVVLASDLSGTHTEWKPQGDVAVREMKRTEAQKIYVSDDKRVAVCMSGSFDRMYVSFLQDILKGKINAEKATKRMSFAELKNLNLKRWGGGVPDSDYMNGLLMATRFEDKPALWSCWPLGAVKKISDWTSVGSGSEYACKYIAKQRLLPAYLSLPRAVRIAYDALGEASQDIFTGGADIVVVTPGEIKEFGSQIKDSLKRASDNAVRKIQKAL